VSEHKILNSLVGSHVLEMVLKLLLVKLESNVILIVHGINGEIGLLVPRHAKLELKPESATMSLQLELEPHVLVQILKTKIVTLIHVLSIVP